jgi:hypothetical protein
MNHKIFFLFNNTNYYQHVIVDVIGKDPYYVKNLFLPTFNNSQITIIKVPFSIGAVFYALECQSIKLEFQTYFKK